MEQNRNQTKDTELKETGKPKYVGGERLKDIDEAATNDDKNANEAEKGNVDVAKPDKKTVHANLEGVPIDTGWAWVVLSGCIFYMLIFGGLMRSYGVFFLQFQERFQANASEVAMMNLIQNIVVSISGLLVMTVGMKKLGFRVVVAIGGGLNAIGYLITGFAKNIGVFYFSQGVLAGTGMAMLHPPMLAIIGVYFKKHRGLANSMFTGSGAMGGLIFAPVVTTVFQEYGYTGALLIVSGLLLNSFVSASLMRSPKWYIKRHKKHIMVDEAKEPLMNKSKHTENVSDNVGERKKVFEQKRQTCKEGYEMEPLQSFKPERLTNGVPRRTLLERSNSFEPKNASPPTVSRARAWSHVERNREWPHSERTRTMSVLCNERSHSHSRLDGVISALDKSKSALYSSGDVGFGSVVNSNINVQKKNECTETEDKSSIKVEKTCCFSVKSNLIDSLSTVLDCKLLKNIAFIQFLGMAFVTLSGMALVPVYLPPYARDNGVSYNQIAIMLSVMACLDLVSKITSGIIADRKWVRRTTILGTAALASGTLCHLVRFFTSFPLIMTLSSVMACFNGLYNAMFSTILIDVIGMGKFQSSLGFVTLVHGISIAIFFPISGLIRDIMGSYVFALHLCGLLAYTGAILLFLLPVVQNKEKAKREKGSNQGV